MVKNIPFFMVNEMKSKSITKLVLLSLLCLVVVPMAQATQPIIKEITHEVLDGPYEDFYAKGVMHGTLVGRVVGGTLRAKIGMIQKLNIYELLEDDEAGDFLAVLNMDIQYSGIVESNGDLEMITGTYSATWVIIVHGDVELPFPEEATLKGHVTRIYRDGVPVKEIIHGVPPFDLP